jgi:alkaline phosphatase D
MPLLRLFVALFLIGCQNLDKTTSTTASSLNLKELAIMQGATDQTNTILSIMVPTQKTLTYSIYLDKTVLKTPEIQENTQSGFDWKVVNMELSGLEPGALYTLKVFENDNLIDERQFKTFSKDLKFPKIAVISCTDDRYVELQKKQWSLVWSRSPDMLFMIGDNVYVDTSKDGLKKEITAADIWRRYQETRHSIDLYKMKTLIPVFATWDDHDYGMNNADSRFVLKESSKNIFKAFFPTIKTPNIEQGPGVSSYMQMGKNHFIFFDDRFYRSEKKKTPGDTHFGKIQEEWFFNILRKKKGVFWLISGDQFFGGYHRFESYEGDHPQSFKNFLDKIKARKKIVLFISGDRHIAELMRTPKKTLGYSTYELTSSGLHAKMFPGSLKDSSNPLAVFAKDGESNFLLIEPRSASIYKTTLGIEFLGENGRQLYSSELEIHR